MGKLKIDKRGVNSWLWTNADKRSYTPAYISSVTGISKHILGAFRDNARFPHRDQLDSLCALFGEDADEVARRYGYPKKEAAPQPEETVPVPAAEVTEAEGQAASDENVEEEIMPVVTEVEKIEKATRKNTFRSETFGISAEKKAEFGKWFSYLVAGSGFTVKEYAELIAVCPNTVSNCKSGSSIPSLETLQTVCKQHDIDWRVAACFFSYADYRVPEYWLGSDYTANKDWISIQKIVRGEVPTAAKKDPSKKKEFLKAKMSSEIKDLKAKVASLEQENRDLRVKMEAAAARSADVAAGLRSQLEKSEREHKEEVSSLKERLSSLQSEKAKASKGGTDNFTGMLRAKLKEFFPKAEIISVTTDGKSIIWSIRLPGMKDAVVGSCDLKADQIAAAIHNDVRNAVLSKLGI